MKKFNINDSICIQITEKGWKHLEETVGVDYIEHCIKPYKEWIEGGVWYRLQAHEVFSLLPMSFGGSLNYNTTIMFNKKDLK